MTDLCHTYQKKLIEIPLSQIIPNPMQPRTNFYESDISELSASIKQLGIINPVCVRPYRGRYELIAGERRFRAAKMAGIYSMPCIIINADDEEASLMALTENIQRKNLNYFEQANAMNLILKTSSITQSELAQKLGKSQSAAQPRRDGAADPAAGGPAPGFEADHHSGGPCRTATTGRIMPPCMTGALPNPPGRRRRTTAGRIRRVIMWLYREAETNE